MHLLFKKRFETPKEAIFRYQQSGILSKEKVYTYAGRLDPLASGILPVLEHTELEQKQVILSAQKTYEVKVLFGVSTDSFDVLGHVFPQSEVATWHTLQKESDKESDKEGAKEKGQYIGMYTQWYPFFSSQPVEGMPLFAYTRLHGISHTNNLRPTKQVAVLSCEEIAAGEMSAKELAHEVREVIGSMKGDFRQEEILQSWELFFAQDNRQEKVFTVKTYRMTVTSGFYVRAFACWLGQLEGTGGLALDIKRIAIGPYTEKDLI